MRTVGQVAAEFGVTVRTLHHYEEIGLLPASERTHSGYRLSSDDDLVRLRQIVAYRRLGFSLEDVASVLESSADALSHLKRQRAVVSRQLDELSSLAGDLRGTHRRSGAVRARRRAGERAPRLASVGCHLRRLRCPHVPDAARAVPGA